MIERVTKEPLRVREERMLAKLESNEPIETPDEMSDEYYQHLCNLLFMQADSELAGGFGYMPWIAKAPTITEKYNVSIIVKDEIRHAYACYNLLEKLGVPVEDYIKQNDFMLRDFEHKDLGTQRLASDKRVNIFYYPINTWADFVMFNFCMDRGAGHQLEDVKHCSYGPWARTIEGIFREEMMHVGHGEMWVEKFAKQSPETKEEIQIALNTWYPRTMNIFGKSNSKKNAEYRKFKLKLRDNGEVRETYKQEVKVLVEDYGLELPDWKEQ
ncbi:MAG: phenylacetate-CoA oxygenase subunit PaaI [bacterium]|nr:phenylacetate-CoA oxygenase subunit PaaI [bacterium]